MKATLLFFFLFTTCLVFGQRKASTQVDLTAVGNLIGRATPAQVVHLFGDASNEVVTPKSHLLSYRNKADSSQCLFSFDSDHILRSFTFDSQKSAPQLRYSTAREARMLSSRAAILDKLGFPTQLIVKGHRETWYYKSKDKKSGDKDILVSYDLLQPQVVNEYKFYADLKTPKVFSSDIVSELNKGISSLDDVEKKLGEPTKIIMGTTTENWYYISQKTTLIVYFDSHSKVDNYFFSKESND